MFNRTGIEVTCTFKIPRMLLFVRNFNLLNAPGKQTINLPRDNKETKAFLKESSTMKITEKIEKEFVIITAEFFFTNINDLLEFISNYCTIAETQNGFLVTLPEEHWSGSDNNAANILISIYGNETITVTITDQGTIYNAQFRMSEIAVLNQFEISEIK